MKTQRAQGPKTLMGKRRTAAKNESSASYQKRRQEIAEAGVRVFDRLGFQGASISAVAAELGIDRASIYYYISSKEELFDEVIRTVIERNAEMAERIRRSDAAPRDKLHELIVALMKSYGDHYPLIYIYIRENLSHVSDKRSAWSTQMRALNHIVEDAIIAIIGEGEASGAFRAAGDPRVLAYGVLGVVGWTHRWFRPADSAWSAEEIGRVYADMLIDGLTRPSPP